MSTQGGLKHAATEPTQLTNKREPRRGRAGPLRRAPSDSDCSGETASLSADSERRGTAAVRGTKGRSRRRGSEWEVLEGLKDGQRFEKRPEVFNGYLHKKRKWPLKGWHKRYFVIDGGILVYARSPEDVARGRLHGSLDVGLSVVSGKERRRRVDIDADDTIYHLRAKTTDVFRTWLVVLRTHRLYRQHLLTFGARESMPKIHPPLDDLQKTETTSQSGGPLENASKELAQAQLSVQQLQRLLDALEMHHHIHIDNDQVSLEGASPNVKKDRRKFGLRKKKSNSKCVSVDLAPPQHIDTSNSHMALSTLTAPPSPGGCASSITNSAASLPIAFLSTYLATTLVPCAAARPQSLPGAESLAAPSSLVSVTPDLQVREDFTVLAKDLVASLKTIVATLSCERGRLRAAVESTESPSGAVLSALRTNLSSALQQNSELRSRLSRIHDVSDVAEMSTVGHSSDLRQFQPSLSYSSSCVSTSEFFDAEEHHGEEHGNMADEPAGVIELDGDSSSEAGSLSSEEGSASSDNSDGALLTTAPEQSRTHDTQSWSRRTRLPSVRPVQGGPSLWNLLYRNIGKDLSQVSMPVTINEPLNMLQRLCEELEYCSLLEQALSSSSEVDRTLLVATFAVSSYAAGATRAASKPFNPLLAETYECVRDDKGFRFIAEQVSHHPPVSACSASGRGWRVWQEARIRTKFWGKSMEVQPAGRVHLWLQTGQRYSWNKVTTCVHNLFGGQRWVDQYGEMHITCHGTDISCKLNFIKASSWSTSRHEVRGVVLRGDDVVTRLTGTWSGGLTVGDPPAARVLWRPDALPPDHELYYGFTRFAMELNEMEPGLRELLPHTDTRLRPDQRALEEGDVEGAERHKLALERAQRERRNQPHEPQWFRKSMEDGEEMWVFNGEYWKAREAGFPDNNAPVLW